MNPVQDEVIVYKNGTIMLGFTLNVMLTFQHNMSQIALHHSQLIMSEDASFLLVL